MNNQVSNKREPHADVTRTAINLREAVLKKQRSSEEEYLILVEQEPVLQERYIEILKPLGLKCKCVSRGDLVYSELINTKCKIMIMDPMLPGIDGLEITKTIREIFNLEFPIIMLTNMVSKSIVKEAYLVGVDDYLIKTDIENKDLVQAVKDRIDTINYQNKNI